MTNFLGEDPDFFPVAFYNLNHLGFSQVHRFNAKLSNVQFLSNYNEILEWSFFGFALSFALFSATFGFKLHKNPLLMSGFALGILMLVLGRSAEAFSLFEGGGILSIVGGAVLFGSHFYSMRCCREG